MENFKNLNLFFKCFVISIFVSFGLFFLTIPFLFFNLGEITFGLLLGEYVSMIFCLISGALVNSKKAIDKKPLIITMVSLRLIVLGGLLFLIGYMYYSLGIHLFNLFAVVGGYFIPLIILMILALKERNV